jgi:hypothetical protein
LLKIPYQRLAVYYVETLPVTLHQQYHTDLKKLVTGILALLYLLASSGVVLNVHYCMGQMAGVEVYADHDDTCGKCGMKEQQGGCCSDELKVYKLEDAHKQVTALQATPNPDQAGLLLPTALPDWQLPAEPNDLVTDIHPPPDLSSPPIYLANRVFRI